MLSLLLFLVLVLHLLHSVISAPHTANSHALLAQPPPTRNLPIHLRNITHNACCISPGLTFDPCTTLVPCAYGRYCVTPDSLHQCPPGIVCICYPSRIILCQDPAHCPLGETCAYRPQDPQPFCVSINVVEVDPSYLIFRGGCVPCSTSRPPTVPPPSPPPVSPPPSSPALPSVKPPPSPSKTPHAIPPTTKPPTETQPPTQSPTEPPTVAPPTKPPTAAPPTGPPTVAPPSRRPSPSPLKSRPPSPYPSPQRPPSRPSHRPVITVVPSSPRPSHPPDATPQPRPSPTTKEGLAGDPCSSTKPCYGYRKCMRKDTLKDCDGDSHCICLGSRVCICNDQCTDGEVCAGAPGRSYCFSPHLIESLSWSTTLPCVGPVISPEVGGGTHPPTTTPPPMKIPGLTGERCRTDVNCRAPRKCIGGGGESCIAGDVLCEKDPTPCQHADQSCYCYTLNTCHCSNDCKETEICTATTQGRICVSRTLLSQSEYLQAIECPTGQGDDGKPILIVNEPQPEPPVALTGTPRPTPSPVRVPGRTPEVLGQDAGSGEGVCIDASALQAFETAQLVFQNHPIARVLCDSSSSCATPGHIVVYHGQAMMMKSYCKLVGCVDRIMQVNSPRLRRRLRVPSNSDGLHFTAFAAKYGTMAEEALLVAVVRVGM